MKQRSFQMFCFALTVLIGLMIVDQASASPIPEWRTKECRFANYIGGPSFNNTEVQLTIACAVKKWPVYGGLTAAYCVAEHESGYDEKNYNPSSGASGVYQFLRSTWSGVVSSQSQIFDRWNLSTWVFNARSNVIAAIRMVHMGSWHPWSVRYLCGVG